MRYFRHRADRPRSVSVSNYTSRFPLSFFALLSAPRRTARARPPAPHALLALVRERARVGSARAQAHRPTWAHGPAPCLPLCFRAARQPLAKISNVDLRQHPFVKVPNIVVAFCHPIAFAPTCVVSLSPAEMKTHRGDFASPPRRRICKLLMMEDRGHRPLSVGKWTGKEGAKGRGEEGIYIHMCIM